QVFAVFPPRSRATGFAVIARCTTVPVPRRFASAALTAALLGLTNEGVLLPAVLHPARPAAVRVNALTDRNWRRFTVEYMDGVLVCRWGAAPRHGACGVDDQD